MGLSDIFCNRAWFAAILAALSGILVVYVPSGIVDAVAPDGTMLVILFSVPLVGTLLVPFLFGLWLRRYGWLWGPCVLGGQMAWGYFFHAGDRNLDPLAIYIYAVLLLPIVFTGVLGVYLGKRRAKQSKGQGQFDFT
jgi:apolipoprotein N-acyltransferase